MKNKTFVFILIILVSLIACNRHWVRIEGNEKIVWEKMKIDLNNPINKIDTSAFCNKKMSLSRIIHEDGYSIYEYDSIRIYILEKDTLLKTLTSNGFIQGQFFFSNHKANTKNSHSWKNPIKVVKNKWAGYHLYISNIRELKNINPPREVEKKRNLSKVYRFNYRYSGQPYINPSVFRIEIENIKYKLIQQNIDFEQFIYGAKTVSFYQSGVEI